MTVFLILGVAGGLALAFIRSGVTVPAHVRGIAFGTVGAAAGTVMTRPVLQTIIDRPLVAVGGVLATLVVSLAIGQLLRLNKDVSPVTAVFSSIAGGASGITVLAKQYDADEATVLSIQYLRVLAVTLTIPLLAPLLGDSHASVAGATQAGSGREGLMLFAVAVVGGYVVAHLLGMTAAQVFIPLVIAAALTISGTLPDAEMPMVLLAVAYGIVGLTVGLGLTPQRLRSLARVMPLAVIQIALSLAACTVVGVVFARAAGVSTLDGYLATTPGGLPAVAAITVEYGEEVGLILAMQALRLIAALALVPVVGRFFARRSGPA